MKLRNLEMEGNPMINATLEKEVKMSSSGNDDEKVDEHGSDAALLNGVEEVEPPKIGMVFAAQEEVRDYYNKYAQQEGFGILRRSSRCDDDGRLTYIVLACSRSGKDRGITRSRFHWRQTPKTNCKAKINVVLNAHGQFHVCNVVLDHNHELTPGKLHRNICKKSNGFRVKKRCEQREQARTIQHPDFHSVFGESLNSEKIPPGGIFPNQSANVIQPLQSICVGRSTGETTSNRPKRRSLAPEGSQNSQDSLRHALAKRAVALVKSGMVIGLGTGNTLSLVIEELGKLIGEGKLKDIVAVAANYQFRMVARQFGMTTVDLNDVNDIDIAFDGVDEVDFNKNILKCRGASHTVQKISRQNEIMGRRRVIDSMAKICVILAEHMKVVHRLGSNIPVVVEVLPIAVSPVLRRLISLGGVTEIRSALRKDGSVITDHGNMVVDVRFPCGIQNPAELEKNINMIPGVVDNGIVSGVATFVLVAVKDGGNIKVMNLEEYVEVVVGFRDTSSTL